MSGPDRRRVSAAEIADLTRRLRVLSEAGRDADARERAEFLADKRALLDRITDHDQHPNREETMSTDDQAAGRQIGDEVRTEFDAVPGRVLHRHNVFDNRGAGVGLDDDDGWVSGGYEAAHQAHLDYLAGGGDRGADARAAEAAQAAEGRAAEAVEPGRADRPEAIAARIQEIRDQLHAQALAEDQQRGPSRGAAEDSDGLEDGAGWSR